MKRLHRVLTYINSGKWRKYLAVLLAVMLLVQTVPLSVFAEESFAYELTAEDSGISEEDILPEEGLTGEAYGAAEEELTAEPYVSAEEGPSEEAYVSAEEGLTEEAYVSGEEELAGEPDVSAEEWPVEEPEELEEPEEESLSASTVVRSASDDAETVEFKDTASFGDAEIAVYASEGAFPEGAVLSVGEIPAEKQADLKAAVEELRDDGRRVAASYTFDIKVLDEDGATELEVADASKVRVFFSIAEAADPNLKAAVYHVSSDETTGGLSAEELDILPVEEMPAELEAVDQETVVTVETEGFSYYTVEFTYDEMQYVMEGDSSVLLDELLSQVGLSGEAESVEVSDDTLLTASFEDGAWVLTALKAFASEEWMKVTIGGMTYEITVTDDGPAQVKKSIITKTEYTFHGQVFTDKVLLMASPANAAAGERVTLKLESDDYYGIVKDGFTVCDGNNREVSLPFEAQGDGSYTFVVPDDPDNDTYTIAAEIEWTDAPDAGTVKTQNIMIASGIEHGTIYAKYLPYAGSSLYEKINSASHAGTVKTVYDTPKPVWLYAEPEEGYELKEWKVEAVYMDELDGEPDGSLPVERIDGADESGDVLQYPWLFELGAYFRNSNKYICFRISAEFQEIQEPVYEPHSITVTSRDVGGGEPTGSSISAYVTEGEELVEAAEAKKGDIVTLKVDLQPGTGLSEGPNGTLITVSSSSASGSEIIDYAPVEGEEDTYTFVMPDREVEVFALFTYIKFTVIPAPLPTRTYVHYAFYRNGTGLINQIGAGYFDNGKETWVKTEGSALWQARPVDKVALDVNAWYENMDTVPGTLRLLDAETGEAVGEPVPLKAINETGTKYRAEMTMPSRDITFAVDMVPCYAVNLNKSDYGVFGAFPNRAREGEKIVIRATPDDSRYDVIWNVTWTDEQGEVHDVEFTKDPDDGLSASFIMPAADVQVTGEFSLWKSLQHLIDEAEDGGTITLGASYTALGTDTNLVVKGKNVTIDLNGYTIDRSLKEVRPNDGHVFFLTDGATLTILDSSGESSAASYGEDGTAGTTGTGLITGGRADAGGAFYVDGASTLNIRGGIISGNGTTGMGGGIYVEKGTLNMTGGILTRNLSNFAGGGLFSSDTANVSLENAAITDNAAGYTGGGVYLRTANDAGIKDCLISGNGSAAYGGGLFIDAKNRTLQIANTKINNNASLDDGGGIYAQSGTLNMTGGTISDNYSECDGGGVKVTSGTGFTASDVTISGNEAHTEEGGGVKNHGTATLVGCVIENNKAAKQGGGIFNDNDGSSKGTMTLDGCTVRGNKSESDGGGIYSDRKLTIIGGEISGNTAVHGGGVYISSGSEDTGISADAVIRDNEATTSAHNLYLRSGRRLALTGALTDGADIRVDLETGTGVLTKGYYAFNGTDQPEAYFTVAKGYDMRFTDEGEVTICSEWAALKKQIESASSGTVFVLDRDYAAASSDDRITISKDITIDLNGYTLNRNRLSKKDNGQILEVLGGGTLTLIDSSQDKTGLITGGWTGDGGGIYVNANGTLNLRGVRIAGNRADNAGGGVYVKGVLNITDGRIEENSAGKSGGIRVEKGAEITLQGSPVVWGNTAAKEGTDLYLSSKGVIGIAGPLTDGTKVGVAIQSDWGVFTSGYGEQNPDEDPALFFESTEGHGVHRENGEAVLGTPTYGGTEYEDPFIDGSNQINPNTLTAQNWMSGLSGERRLNEINMPGSHDSGMNNVQNIKTSQGITWIAAGFTVASIALTLATGGTASIGLVGLAGIGLSLGLPNDYTSALAFFMEDAAAPKAKTQREYIDQQLADGCRQLDLRLYHKHKVYKWYINGYKYEDDDENLWVCHGKKGGGRYIAQDEDDDDLSFSDVLTWVKDFLRLHPTETIILDLRPETEDDKEKKKIYPRARDILESVAMEINPSTGEPYLYKDPESSDYFASYDRMPKLADCRGKIVLMPDNDDFRENVGGFVRGNLITGEALAQLDYENTKEQMVSQMESEYDKVNGDGSVTLPTDVDSKINRLWYWELNCTGQHAGIGYATMDAPHDLAQYVNSHLIGKDKLLSEERAGQYIGWVRMDSFNAKNAEVIWRTNFFDGLEYCTVTVKSGLSDEKHYPDQTYRVLEGTRITIPGNIYKRLDDGQYFAYWETDDGTRYNPGAGLRVRDDITLTARWMGEGEIPVRANWKDVDDKDGLRPEILNLVISIDGAPADVTLTKEGGWSGVIHVLEAMRDEMVITPDWAGIDTTDSAYGTDAEGLYRYELSYDAGTGYTITLIHTPKGSVSAAGTVEWEDDENTAGKRPETVRIRLYKNGAATGGSAEVSAGSGWQYTFGSRKQYEDGVENVYTIAEDGIENYKTEIDGFTVINTYSPDAQSTVSVEGLVMWDDAGNAKGLRPEKTLVYLMAGDEEAGSREVTPSEIGLWHWTIDNVPVTDAAGGRIEYNIVPEEIEGYHAACERIGLTQADGEEEEGVESNAFLITYTLDVPDEEKTDVVVYRAPEARELSYSAAAQELIEEGIAGGGRMMYALGDSADTPPEASAFSTKLPVGTDAGLYHVWYYVKADVTHRDSAPQLLEVTVGRTAPTLEAADIRITDGDAGKTAGASVTGVEGSTEGLGSLSYEITEGSAVTVDASTGELTVHSTGTAKLTVSVPETVNYTADQETVTVTVVHQHDLEKIDAKAASCEEDGNTAYWICSEGDGKCFSGEDGLSEISKESTVIPALGHNWGEWTVTKESTETAEGEERRICKNDPTHVETRVIPMMEHVHKLVKVEAVPATCEEDGSITYWVCSGGSNPCGRYFSDAEGTTGILPEQTVISATGHTAGTKEENRKEASCTEAGSYDLVSCCTVCGKELDRRTMTIAALGHIWDEGAVTKEAACTTPGVKTFTCTRDASHTRTEEIEPLGHDFGEWTVTKEAMETSAGEETRVCKHDPAHVETRVIPVKAHVHQLVKTEAKAATCEEEGNIAYWVCSGGENPCGRYFADAEGNNEIAEEDTVTSAPGHDWDEGKITKEAGCTTEGELLYTCRRDPSHTKTETISPTGHKGNTVWRDEEISPADCTQAGYYYHVFYCRDCDEILTYLLRKRPALGHDFGEWTVTKEATETAEGEERRVCKNDPSHVETRVIPSKEHVHQLVKVEAVPASCEKDGNIAYRVCSAGTNPCGRYFSDEEGTREILPQQTVIPATGHTAGTKEENRKEASCTEAGSYDLVSCCTVCGKELDRRAMTIAALGHIWDEGVVTKEAACTTPGIKTYTCTRDASHTRTEDIAPIGHDFGEWTVTTEATETAEGEESRVCRHDPSHVETRVIPVKAHVHQLVKTEAKAAACEKEGNIAYWVCSGGENPCGRYFSDAEGNTEIAEEDTVIPAPGHDWDEGKITKEAGCTTEGELLYTCRRDSSHTKTERVSPTGHKGNTAWRDEVITAADCTHAGDYYHIFYCMDCGEILAMLLMETPALGHDFGEWIVTKKATAEEPGVRIRYCRHDPTHTETDTIAWLPCTAPAAITGLIYNKEEQSLVSAGTAEGGTVQYALGTNAETAPAEGWSTSVPAAVNAGTYDVWYRIIGDSEHADTEPHCIEAAIGKADAVIRYKEETVRKQCDEPAFTNPLLFTGDGTVSYRSDNTAVAAVDADGLVTIKGVGTAAISAAAADGANYRYDPAEAGYLLTVVKKPGSIGFELLAVEKTYGDMAFTNPLLNSGDGTVSYASDNTAVATVDPDSGKVTIVGAGETTITATVTDGAETTYAKKTDSCHLTVKKADNPGFVSGSTTVVSGGNTTDLKNLVRNAEGAVSYAISGESLGCSINEKTGVFTSGNESGTVKVSVTFAGNDRYNPKAVDLTVNIVDKTIRRFFGSVTRTYGDPLNLPIMTPMPEGAEPDMQFTGTLRSGVPYESDEEPTEAGEYILTLTYEDDDHIWLETIAFTILPRRLGRPDVVLGDPLIYNGSEQTQTVESVMWGEELLPASEYTVTDNRGTDAGTYTLTVTARPDGNYNGSVTKEFAIARAAGVIRADAENVRKVCGDAAFYSGFTITGDGTVTYASGDESVAAVDPVTGEVTIAGVGETTITAAAADGQNYHYDPAEAGYVLTVGKKAAEISFDPAAVEKTYGDESFINPLLNSGDGTVSYMSDNTDAATVDAASGEVTIVGAGEAAITATVTDGVTSAYEKKTASFLLTVKKADNPGFVSGSAAVKVGETTNLKDLVKNAVGTVSYTISGEELDCLVDEETGVFTAGYITGDVPVEVTISGNKDYRSKTGSIRVQVSGMNVRTALAQGAIIYGENTLDGFIRKNIKFPENVSPSIHYTGTARNGESYDSDTAPANAGDYLVTISYEHNDTLYKGLIMARIMPKSIEEAAVELDGALTYNGSEQTRKVASVTVKDPQGADVVIPVSEYTVTGNQVTEAGDYTLTVKANPKGNYTDSVTKEFRVAKAKAEISYTEETLSKTYGDAAFVNELSNTGDGTVRYTSGDESVAAVDPASGEVTITGVGRTTITAAVQDGMNHYYDTRTAVYSLNVAKAAAVIGTAPAPVPDLIYNGTPQTLVTAGKTTDGTMVYALGTNASTPPKDSAYTAEIPAVTDAGTWYVWYKAVGDDKHSDSKAMVQVTVTIRKREAELEWSGTPLIYDGTAKGPTAAVKNLAAGDECTVTVEGKAVNAGKYTARATALSNTNYRLPQDAAAEFSIQKAAGKISFAAGTVEKTHGDTAFTNELTNEGDGEVTFSSDNSSVAAVDEATGEVTINGVGSATITATASEGSNYRYDPAAVSYTLTVAAAAASAFKAPATAMNLVYTGSPQTLVTMGEAAGGTIQYVLGTDGKTPPSDDAGWSTDLPAGTDAGLYYVWYRVVGDANHSSTAPVPMNGYIAPAASRGSVAAKTLYYTGGNQALAEIEEAEGGELLYALGTDAETAPDPDSDAWSNQIPQGKNVGDYYVWFYITGDENHRDTAPEVKTVTILPKPVSYTVTFKVSCGSWDNASADDITVKLEGYETEDSSPLKLSPADIPAVGNRPEQYYTAGSWDVTPDTDAAITENTSYTYTYQKIAYKLTEGGGQTYMKKSGGSLRFVIKRSSDDGTTFSHFSKVTCGEPVLLQGEDYTAASGSLVLTLRPAFLETLNPGTHTVSVYFDDVSDADSVPVTFAVTTPAVYTVTFDGNGHGTTPAAQTVADGDKAAKPADPTAAGWTFGGWFTEAECQNAYDFDTQVTGDRTLYAKWTADSQDSTPESTPDSTSDDSTPDSTPDSSSDDTPKGSTADSASNDTAKGNTSDDTSDNTANDNTSDNASRRSSGSTPGGSSNSTSDRTAGSSYVEAPKTGDPNQIWLFAMMLFIGMAGLMSVAVSYGRSRRKEQYAGQDVRDEEGPGQGS